MSNIKNRLSKLEEKIKPKGDDEIVLFSIIQMGFNAPDRRCKELLNRRKSSKVVLAICGHLCKYVKECICQVNRLKDNN